MLAHIVLYAIAALLIVAGMIAVHFSAFADRSKGRPRCPKCWYDMTGSRGFVCPECGHDAANQKNLHRTRRYRMKALLGALLVFSGCSLAALPTVQEQGWTALIPTTGLMIVLPWSDNEWVLNEVDARVNATNPEWFRRHDRDISDYGKFFAHRCAAIITAGRSQPLRLRAVQLLSDMRLRDDIAELALLQATSDPDPTIRIEALNAIAQVAGAQSIIDPGRCAKRVAECLSDTRVAVRTRAARVFDFLQPPHPDAVPPLIEALSDERAEVRSAVCDVLVEFGSLAEQAVPALTRLIDDPSSGLSANAIRALGSMGVTATPTVDKIILALDAHDRRTDAALRALANLGPVAVPAIPRVTAMLTDESFSPQHRFSAVLTLLAIDPYNPEVLNALEIASKIGDLELARLRIATEIGRYRADEPQQVRILLSMLHDPARSVRQAAALSLGRLAPLRPDEIERLQQFAGDPEFIGWEEAQSALSRALEKPEADAPTGDDLENPPNESRR